MRPKIISSNDTHGNPHPTIYKGNNWDYHLSLLPVFVPLPLFTVPNAYCWRDPILSPKVLYSLLEVYQTFESTHFWKGGDELRRLRIESGAEEEKTKKRRVYRKIKSKRSRRLTKRIKVSSDRLLVSIRARMSWKNLQVQSICAKTK